MDRTATLREQAKVLRVLAASFDIPSVRDELLDLAKSCEALAASIEAEHRDAEQDPLYQVPPSGGR